MIVYLIRHGKTLANEQRLYCGATDLPLSPAGAAELKTRAYPPLPGCRYVTSGMARCRQTLEALFGLVPFETEPGLREMDFGDFEMRGYDTLKNDPAYRAWLTGDNEKNTAPGGESGEAMGLRALAAFDKLVSRGEDLVIVTHGGVIAAIMAALFPGEGKNRYQWQSPPGKGYRLEKKEAGWRYAPLP